MKARNLFLSLEARGKFGNIAVANIVRGIQVIKKKRDPIDRKTPGQIVQRRKYEDGRIFYNSLRLTERDKNAISRYARLAKIKLNPFQMFLKWYLIARRVFPTAPFCHQVISNSPPSGKLYIYCEAQSGINLLVGVNRSFNNNFVFFPMLEFPGTGKYEMTIPGLLTGEKYYFLFLYIDPSGFPRPASGIYSERTK